MLQLEWHEFVLTALAFAICAVIILVCKRFPRLSGRSDDLLVVQSMHTRLTPRIGGVAIFGALGLSVIFAPVSISGPYGNLFLATSLLFFVGLAEDLGFHISPKNLLI